MAALDQGPDAIPARLEASGRSVSSALALTAASASGSTVVMPLLHGPLGEDGTVQGLLELLDVPYVGAGVLASAVGMDKAMSKDVLARHGIAQPRYVAVRDSDVSTSRLEHIAAELRYPIFVKPANMGSSVGVSKAHDFDELVAATDIAMTYDEWLVFEEAIVGREIEVAVLGSHQPQASVAGEIVPGHEFYDYEDKYVTDAATLNIPAPLTSEQSDAVRALAIEAYEALHCEGMARVDFFFEENGRGFLCNEINTIPGFTPISMYPKLWNASGHRDCMPNFITYSSLLNVVCKSKSLDKAQMAWDILSEMEEQSIPPNIKSYNSAMMACAFSESFDLQSRERAFMVASEIFQRANSQLNDKPSAETYCFFFRAAAGLGHDKEVEDIYKLCCQAGFENDEFIQRDFRKVALHVAQS